MLSLAQPTYAAEDDNMIETRENTDDELDNAMGKVGGASRSPHTSPTNTRSNPFGPGQGQSRWGTSSMFGVSPNGQSSLRPGPPSMQSLTTNSPPSSMADLEGDNGDSDNMMDMADPEDLRSPLRFLPSHLDTSASRRKGKGKSADYEAAPAPKTLLPPHGETIPGGLAAFHRKPLPATLLATLISETDPQEHEMQSEARMQRFMHSHASRLPFTPRASKSTRGRFPEMADNEDEDMPPRRPSYRDRTSWTNMRMDSDSDSDDEGDIGEPVNAAFAAGMDLDRPMSSSMSSTAWPSGNVSESGKMTPGSGSGSGPSSLAGQGNGPGTSVPTPPAQNGPWGRPARMSFSNMVSSPGTGLALPGAFGSLAMGGITPLGSPTLERLEVSLFVIAWNTTDIPARSIARRTHGF